MNEVKHKGSACLVVSVVLTVGLFFSVPCSALEPHEIMVLANRNAVQSVSLAKYYMKQRGVPEENLLQLWVSDEESCSREEYDKAVAVPVRKHLQDNDPFGLIRCIVLMYGVPLKARAPKMTLDDQKELEKLEKRRTNLNEELRSTKRGEGEKREKLNKALKDVSKRIAVVQKTDQSASLDSEIALVLEEDYSLSSWVPNPHFIGYQGQIVQNLPRKVMLVCRLDGPSEEVVRNIIEDSIGAEEQGLTGNAYFDARFPNPGDKKVESHAFYDKSIHLVADRVKKSELMPVIIDDTKDLFKPGQCPEAALYCGWYSLRRYVDAFSWQPGSVGYHIASGECVTLRRENSQVWCKMMLEKGVAATIGPVSEPYVQAFPIPEIFFGLLIEGKLTLAECYAMSNPFLSWKMVLIGDPLYRPFKNSRTKHGDAGPN